MEFLSVEHIMMGTLGTGVDHNLAYSILPTINLDSFADI